MDVGAALLIDIAIAVKNNSHYVAHASNDEGRDCDMK